MENQIAIIKTLNMWNCPEEQLHNLLWNQRKCKHLDSYQYSNNTIMLFATQYTNDSTVFHPCSLVSGDLASFLSVGDCTSSNKVLCERFDTEELVGREKDAGRLCESGYMQQRSQTNFVLGDKNFDFTRATVFCSRHCLSKHKMTRWARNFGSMAPLASWLRLWLQEKNEEERTVLTWCLIFHWQKARHNATPPDTAELRWKVILSVLGAAFGCYPLHCPQTEIACWSPISALGNLFIITCCMDKNLLIMELRSDAMLYSNLGNENSDAGHIKCSRGPQVLHSCSVCWLHQVEQFVVSFTWKNVSTLSSPDMVSWGCSKNTFLLCKTCLHVVYHQPIA